jgi:hypothetical protein
MKLRWYLKKSVLTSSQLERLSNIFDNAGQVVFGIVVLSPLIGGIDRINMLVIVSGVIVMLLLWTVSVWLAKNK